MKRILLSIILLSIFIPVSANYLDKEIIEFTIEEQKWINELVLFTALSAFDIYIDLEKTEKNIKEEWIEELLKLLNDDYWENFVIY